MYRANNHVYKVLVVEPGGKRTLGRPRRIWEDNIKIYIREIQWESFDWIHLAQDRDEWQALVKMPLKLWVPQNMGNFSTG
jgi:hypothetical protein